MPFVLVIHEVEDYGAWKSAFDGAARLLTEAGELEFQVLTDTTNPNRIVHFAKWTSVEKARAFFESPSEGGGGAHRQRTLRLRLCVSQS
jgi:heme-degrading monooxygenase HmoA